MGVRMCRWRPRWDRCFYQLSKGKARIVFDPASETIDIRVVP